MSRFNRFAVMVGSVRARLPWVSVDERAFALGFTRVEVDEGSELEHPQEQDDGHSRQNGPHEDQYLSGTKTNQCFNRERPTADWRLGTAKT